MMNFNLVGKLVSILISSIVLFSFADKDDSPYVIVLGVAQDGGAPHAALLAAVELVVGRPTTLA